MDNAKECSREILSEGYSDDDYPPWITFNSSIPAMCPKVKGHYLVVQRHREGSVNTPKKSFQWVRYWNGREWWDSKTIKYGPIVAYMPLPPLPEPNSQYDIPRDYGNRSWR